MIRGDARLLLEPEPEPLAAAMARVLADAERRTERRARGLARRTVQHGSRRPAADEEALAR